MFYKRQEQLTFHEHLSLLPPLIVWVRVAHLFSFFVLFYYVSLRSEFRVVMSVTISAYKRCSVLLPPVVCMSYLRYLYLFAHSGIQHILCCVFVMLFFVLCALCCQDFPV